MDGRRLVIWGCGELGTRVARLWIDAGGAALGVTRTEDRHDVLRDAGIEPHAGSAVEVLHRDDLLLLCVPGNDALHACAEDLRASGTHPERAVMTSSTTYYGGPSGPVDERTPPGDTDGARAAVEAERAFRRAAGSRAVIVRLGGLHHSDGDGAGPGAAVRRRLSMRPGPPDRTLSLIHYADAALAVRAALVHPAPEPTYVAVTPPLPSRREFYEALAADLDGALALRFTDPTGEPPAVYDVTLLRRDLLPHPTHPDWREAVNSGR